MREAPPLLQGPCNTGHVPDVAAPAPDYARRQAIIVRQDLVEGRGVYCLNVGGRQIDEAVERNFIAALEPATFAASIAAAERLEADREAVLKQWHLGVEQASYEASRAERRYRAVDPDNRLVARGLEREWEET